MDIVNVENFNDIKDCNVFYKLEGNFYGICWNCGKVFKVDYHVTACDIRNNTIPGDDRCHCSKSCADEFYNNN